jgi:hypothetical protein
MTLAKSEPRRDDQSPAQEAGGAVFGTCIPPAANIEIIWQFIREHLGRDRSRRSFKFAKKCIRRMLEEHRPPRHRSAANDKSPRYGSVFFGHTPSRYSASSIGTLASWPDARDFSRLSGAPCVRCRHRPRPDDDALGNAAATKDRRPARYQNSDRPGSLCVRLVRHSRRGDCPRAMTAPAHSEGGKVADGLRDVIAERRAMDNFSQTDRKPWATEFSSNIEIIW